MTLGLFLTGPVGLLAGEEPLIPVSVRLAPKGSVEEAFLGAGGPLRARSLAVAELVYAAPRTRSDLDAEIHPKDLGRVMADAFVAEAGVGLRPEGVPVSRESGELRVTGRITKYLQPRKAATWTGWVGSPSGEGEVRFEMVITDKTGKILLALRHRIGLPAEKRVAEAIRLSMRSDLVPLLLEAAR